MMMALHVGRSARLDLLEEQLERQCREVADNGDAGRVLKLGRAIPVEVGRPGHQRLDGHRMDAVHPLDLVDELLRIEGTHQMASVMPPSTVRTVPVTNEAAGDTRKAAASAISAGWAARPRAISPSSRANCSSSVTPAAAARAPDASMRRSVWAMPDAREFTVTPAVPYWRDSSLATAVAAAR